VAEERLIDDDKDRKYKIRINENGEEELVINPDADEGGDEEVLDAEIPEFEDDDEEAAVMTPEQLAARQKAMQEEAEKKAAKVEELLERGRGLLREENYEGAVYEFSKAQETDGENGEAYALKLLALSRNFTDYTSLDECAEAADGVKIYSTKERKKELSDLAAPLKNRLDGVRAEAEALNEENEAKKSERREAFTARRKKCLISFAATAVPFIIFLVVAVSIAATVMFAREDGTFLILTIVFGALALIFFIATLFTAHNLWDAGRNVRLNESNSSTKLGREYDAKKAELDKLTRIYGAFNDISEEEAQ